MSDRILVVCGLRREAALAGPDVVSAISGGRREHLESKFAALDPNGISAVLSFGLAGGLDPTLAVGDLVIPEAVISGAQTRPTTRTLAEALRYAARAAGLPIAGCAAIAGVDAPVGSAATKSELRAKTGAGAVDMESHVAADYAARFQLPFAIMRVVSDTSDRAIPPAALAAMGDGGRIDARASLFSLLREPGQIPALIGVARDGARAFRQLGRVGGLLRGGLGLHLG